MKKILILLLLIPGFIYADVDDAYVGIVNNKDGAYLYGYDLETDKYIPSGNVVEYGTKVYVIDEFDKYVFTENYVDYLLKEDIKKTDETYEEYQSERYDIENMMDASKGTLETGSKQNKTNSLLQIGLILGGILVVIIVVALVVSKTNKEGQYE